MKSLSKETRKLIDNELKIINTDDPRIVYRPYLIKDDFVHLPFSYAIENEYAFPDLKELRAEEKLVIVEQPRAYQVPVKKRAVELLNRNRVLLLGLHVGWGKTWLAVTLGSMIYNKFSLPIMVLTHSLVLMEQWKESIKHACPDARVRILLPGENLVPGVHFFIMNPQNIEKIPNKETLQKDIGMVVMDECHALMTNNRVDNIFHLCPKFLVGLSATAYRVDDNDILISRFFGKEPIEVPLNRRHTVYRIDTDYEPPMEYQRNGKVDWNVILKGQAMNEKRNDFIVDIVVKSSEDKFFLILCKRVDQVKILVEKLKRKKIDTTYLYGNLKFFDLKSKVLVGIVKKVGVGFSHAKLNTLIVAGDIKEYYIQNLGRVFRTEFGEPVIYDIVDRNPILQRHFQTRKKICIDAGGVVERYRDEIPSMIVEEN